MTTPSASTTLRPMTRFGRYDTLGVLGGGGMATVYVGRAVGAGGFERLVAIKAMHPHLATNPEFVAMFLDEARLAARIRSPNVVATIDLSQGSGEAFLVMEYIEGPSLDALFAELRRRGDRVPIDLLLRMFVDLLAGLSAAHELAGADGEPVGLVHRDVSPQNVLVGTDGVTRITDFGVALAAARLAQTTFGQIKGKLAYAPPEVVMLEPIDRRADIYSAGAVLWEALTGKPLFEGDNELTLGALVLDGVKESPRQVISEVPEAIDAVCMRALAPDREARFATAADMVEALELAAETAGLRVASPRAVATFVKELGAHRRAPEVGAAVIASTDGGVAGDAVPDRRMRIRGWLIGGAVAVAVGAAAATVLLVGGEPRPATATSPSAVAPSATTDASQRVPPSAEPVASASGAPSASTVPAPSAVGHKARPEISKPTTGTGSGRFRPTEL